MAGMGPLFMDDHCGQEMILRRRVLRIIPETS